MTQTAFQPRRTGLILGTLAFIVSPAFFGQSPDTRKLLQSAGAAEQLGRYEEAATLYQRWLSDTGSTKTDASSTIQVRTRLATAYYLLHRYQESLEAVAPLTSPGSPSERLPAQAWLIDGLDRLELGQLPRAIASLRRTIALYPDSGTARLALGDAFERSGRLEDAERQYSEQARRTPSVPDAWYKLGLAHTRLETQVSQDFTRKSPSSLVGQQLTAEELLAKGDATGAAGVLLRMLHRAPHQLQAQADLGAALMELGYTKPAQEHFRQALSQDPECPLARLGLAETAALQGDWEQADSALELLARSNPRELGRFLELSPAGPVRNAWAQGKIRVPERLAETPAGSLWIAWLSNADTQTAFAKMQARRSCTSRSSKAMVTPGMWLSDACYRQLRYRLNALKSPKLEERVKLAEAEFRLGNFTEARRQAKRVLQANPWNEWGNYWLSGSEGELAEECFAKVASLNPDSARVHQMLAQYFASRHNFPRAKSEYLAAIHLAPDLPDLHLGLGIVDEVDGEWEEAEKEYQRTLELAPGSVAARFHLGDLYVQQSRWQPAVGHLRGTVDDPTFGLKGRLDLAKAEAELGETQQAVGELLPVLEKDKDGEIHFRLAALYRKLGDKTREQQALDAFKRLRDASLQADRAELDALEKAKEP